MEHFPKCPVCKKEVLIPLSSLKSDIPKTFAHWICTRCGFYIGTAGSAGYNVPKDIQIAMLDVVVTRVRECTKAYKEAIEKGYFDVDKS